MAHQRHDSYDHLDIKQMYTTSHEYADSDYGSRSKETKKLILCFDGTSNQFQGHDADTNVVKLYEMFDRSDPHQYHYYQPGIGTYVSNSTLANAQSSINVFAKARIGLKQLTDQMFGDSFADHVMAGYRFLMRYFMEGDKIYIFGFSRGAYTARFLTEMLNDIGLLSKGNEEMVPFVWYQYSDYRSHRDKKDVEEKMQSMKRTFCRVETKVYFLGLWDCVNSVAKFTTPSSDKKAIRNTRASPNIATHVRHAVSCHERRVMFRPTLFDLDDNRGGTVKEEWFAGNHGDVGGGWAPTDGILLSDIPLIWMVKELMTVESRETSNVISWRTAAHDSHPDHINSFAYRLRKLDDSLARLHRGECRQTESLRHDVLSWRNAGAGFTKFYMTPAWWLLEVMPLVHTVLRMKRSKEWQRVSVIEGGKPQIMHRKPTKYSWEPTARPNCGRARNIPPKAIINESVKQLYAAGVVPPMSLMDYGPEGFAKEMQLAKSRQGVCSHIKISTNRKMSFLSLSIAQMRSSCCHSLLMSCRTCISNLTSIIDMLALLKCASLHRQSIPTDRDH
ncbi:hypothetical protein MRB53_037767 [Persea americana]|nr:hypothetical protein MRB53_037767 [Persea americana]